MDATGKCSDMTSALGLVPPLQEGEPEAALPAGPKPVKTPIDGEVGAAHAVLCCAAALSGLG